MACRPLPEMVLITARVPRGEAGFWKIMRLLDKGQGPFTIADVEALSNVKAGAVAQYMRKLVKAGFARHISDRPAPARPQKIYELVKRPAESPRLRSDGTELGRTDRECLWCAMRNMRGAFNAGELCYAATTTTMIRIDSAEQYIRYLAAAGYLAPAGDDHWRLKPKMNTGPRAPAILRVDVVFDRNLKRVVGDEIDAYEVTR